MAASGPAFGQGFVGVEMETGEFFGPPQRPAVRVGAVLAGFPADKVGIRPGDVIFRVADVDIENPGQFTREVASRKPGEEVALHILRGESVIVVTLTLAARPGVDANKLIGKWVKVDQTANVEFFGDGSLKIVIPGFKDGTAQGSYTLRGGTLEMTASFGDKQSKEIVTITKLTDSELIGVDSKGKVEQLRKVTGFRPSPGGANPGLGARNPLDVFDPLDPLRTGRRGGPVVPALPHTLTPGATARHDLFDPFRTPDLTDHEGVLRWVGQMNRQNARWKDPSVAALLGPQPDFRIPQFDAHPATENFGLPAGWPLPHRSNHLLAPPDVPGARGALPGANMNPLSGRMRQQITSKDIMNQALAGSPPRFGTSRHGFNDPLARYRDQWSSIRHAAATRVQSQPVQFANPPVVRVPQLQPGDAVAGPPAIFRWDHAGVAIVVLVPLLVYLVERVVSRR